MPEASSNTLAAATQPPRPLRRLKRPGRLAWKRLWTAGQGWLSPATDIELVQRLCEAYDERSELKEEIAKEGQGRMLTSEKGSRYTNPLVWQLAAVDKTITRYEGLCGFTPSDRTRLGLAEVTRQSKLQEFLSKRAASA